MATMESSDPVGIIARERYRKSPAYFRDDRVAAAKQLLAAVLEAFTKAHCPHSEVVDGPWERRIDDPVALPLLAWLRTDEDAGVVYVVAESRPDGPDKAKALNLVYDPVAGAWVPPPAASERDGVTYVVRAIVTALYGSGGGA
jgi:hypothetical protein